MRPNCHTLNILFLSKESLKDLERGRKMRARERREGGREREKSGRQENLASVSKNVLKRERDTFNIQIFLFPTSLFRGASCWANSSQGPL